MNTSVWFPEGGRVLLALAIVVAAFLLAHLLRAWLSRVRKRTDDASSFIYVLDRIGGYLIIAVGLAVAVSTLGVDLETLSLFGGAVGVGVGLGLQGIVREFVSGLVLIFERSICVGDFVEVEGMRGEIVEIGARATRLRTNDDLNVVIPNSVMIQKRVTNWTYSDDTRRLRIAFSVAEGTDKAKVRNVVLAAARALPFTAPDADGRKTQVWLTGFSHDGLEFELVVWPEPESSRRPASMQAAYTWAIHEALLAAGIDMAVSQLDLRVRGARPQGDEALDAAPNDAAAAVFDDAARAARARERPSRRQTNASV